MDTLLLLQCGHSIDSDRFRRVWQNKPCTALGCETDQTLTLSASACPSKRIEQKEYMKNVLPRTVTTLIYQAQRTRPGLLENLERLGYSQAQGAEIGVHIT